MEKQRTPTGITWLFIFISVPLVVSEGPSTCSSTDNNPYLFFGTKTTYDVVRNPQGIPKIQECRPLQVWMVARHGAHRTNPAEDSKFVNLMDLRHQIVKNHERGKGSLCAEDISRLRDWREYQVSSEEQDSLTPQGVRDSYTLGLRVRQAFPALFENSDASKDFVFRHTEMDKSKQTAEYFTKGLFGIIYNPKFPDALDSSNLLEGFESCPAWSYKNAKIQEKVDLFMKGKSMHEVFRNVSQRLGFNYDLPFYAVDAMYQWCTRERSLALEAPSAWCAAFATPELKVMEFLDDLRYFFKTGPGDRSGMNKKLGCPLVRDMLSRFREIEMNPDARRPRGVFYFGEAEAVGLVASRLGIFGDRRPLTTYADQRRRTFRTSALLPWGANVMAVFYHCSTGETYRVMFLVSENVVRLPGCPSGLCPWSLLRHRLSHSLDRRGCPLEFCTRLPHSWVPLTTAELWAVIALVSFILFIIYLFRAINRLTDGIWE